MTHCPCGSGLDEQKCCAPILAGQPAPTAEALMRSRYTAYVQKNIDHVERSSSPKALKEFDRKDVENFMQKSVWKGLEILNTKDGGKDDQTGVVEFIFRCTFDGKDYEQHEVAHFCRQNGAWVYDDSDVNPNAQPARVEQIGRNDPCTCGSGKKYKKCCGG